jgi:hypothetical protein
MPDIVYNLYGEECFAPDEWGAAEDIAPAEWSEEEKKAAVREFIEALKEIRDGGG